MSGCHPLARIQAGSRNSNINYLAMLRILGLFGSLAPWLSQYLRVVKEWLNAQSSQSHGHWLTIPIGIALTNIHESDTKNTNELLDG